MSRDHIPSVYEVFLANGYQRNITEKFRDDFRQRFTSANDTERSYEEEKKKSTVKKPRYASILEAQETDSNTENEEEDEERNSDSLSMDIDIFRQFVIKSPAYKWLIDTMFVEVTQTNSTASQDIRSAIWGNVFHSLHPRTGERLLTRQRPTQPHRITFTLDWDLRSFLKRRRVGGADYDAEFENIVTLTGTAQECQALTIGQYLLQAWPSSGRPMLQLIQKFLGAGLDRGQPGLLQSHDHSSPFLANSNEVVTLADKTTLRMIDERRIDVLGTAASLADVAEQLAWLAATLVSLDPQADDGMHYSLPDVSKPQKVHSNRHPVSASSDQSHSRYTL